MTSSYAVLFMQSKSSASDEVKKIASCEKLVKCFYVSDVLVNIFQIACIYGLLRFTIF